MTGSDLIIFAFEARGADRVINDFRRIGQEQQRMIAGAGGGFGGGGRGTVGVSQMGDFGGGGDIFSNWRFNSRRGDDAGGAFRAISAFYLAMRVLRELKAVVHDLTKEYEDYAREIMNIRDITGASAKEATQATFLFKAAGMTDATAMRDLLRLSRDLFTSQGQGALGMFGISASPNESGVRLILRVIDAIEKSKFSGMQKTNYLETIFGGMRGGQSLVAIEALMRMTKAQREASLALSEAYETRMLPAIQNFMVLSEQVKESIAVNFVFPIMNKLIPSLIVFANVLMYALDTWHTFDTAMKGIPSWIIMFGALAASVALVAGSLLLVVAAAKYLVVMLGIVAVWESVVAVLSGPVGWILLALAAVAGGGMLWAAHSSDDKLNSAGDKMGNAADKMGDAAQVFADSFDKFNKGGIPGSFSNVDMNSLGRQMALGAIG